MGVATRVELGPGQFYHAPKDRYVGWSSFDRGKKIHLACPVCGEYTHPTPSELVNPVGVVGTMCTCGCGWIGLVVLEHWIVD